MNGAHHNRQVERETHAVALQPLFHEIQSLKSENAALTISEAASREALRIASESSCPRTALEKAKAQLASLNQVHSQTKMDIAKLTVHGSASSNYEAVQEQHLKLTSSIDHFNQNMEEMGMKTTMR